MFFRSVTATRMVYSPITRFLRSLFTYVNLFQICLRFCAPPLDVDILKVVLDVVSVRVSIIRYSLQTEYITTAEVIREFVC